MHVVFLSHLQCPTGKTTFQEVHIYNYSRCMRIYYLLFKCARPALQKESNRGDNQSY